MTITASSDIFASNLRDSAALTPALLGLMNASPRFLLLASIANSAGISIRVSNPALGESSDATVFSSRDMYNDDKPTVIVGANDFTAFATNLGMLVGRIGHELAHAADFVQSKLIPGTDGLRPHPSDSSYISPSDYSNRGALDEGLAITNDFLIAKDLGLSTFNSGIPGLFGRMNSAYFSMKLAGMSQAEIEANLKLIAGSAGRNATPSNNEGMDVGLTYGQQNIKDFIIVKMGFKDGDRYLASSKYPPA